MTQPPVAQPDGSSVVRYCGQCGRDLSEGSHEVCEARLVLEPPRYCAQCRRRMVVQVIPRSWTATCVEHGTVRGG